MSLSNNEQQYFVWLSDFHYDPYYATPLACSARDATCNDTSISPLGKWGCDSPKKLVQAALSRAVELTGVENGKSSPPSFVLISGDSVRHGMDLLFEERNNVMGFPDGINATGTILRELYFLVEKAFPDSEIIISLGNNDVFPDYYLDLSNTNENSSMLKVLFEALNTTEEGSQQKTKPKAHFTSADRSTFLRGGFYSRSLHNGELVLLSLNTVLFSTWLEPETLHSEDPGGQFSWIRQMLLAARNSRSQVYLIGHIPPTVGSFRHTQLWKDEYIQKYFEIVSEFDDVVAAQLFGHLHSDEFRVGVDTSHDAGVELGKFNIPMVNTPLLMGPSVTPIHGNNPSFRIMKYGLGSRRYRLLDYESHYCAFDSEYQWSKLYSFSEAYGTASNLVKNEGLSSPAMRSILQSMDENSNGKESPVMKTFRSFVRSGANGDVHQTGANVECDADCHDEWMCTFQSATRAGYDACLLGRLDSRGIFLGKGHLIVAMIGGFFFLDVVLIAALVRWCKIRRRQDYQITPSILTEKDPTAASSFD